MRHLFRPPPRRGGALLPALLLTLAACSQGEEADSPAPNAPTTAADTASEPLTAGEWFIEETADSAVAEFGPDARDPVLRLVCDRGSGTLTLIHIGRGDEEQIYNVEVGGQSVAVQMSPSLTGVPAMLGEVDATQPVFAAFSQTGETIEIGATGEPALRLPGHTGISRVIQACS